MPTQLKVRDASGNWVDACSTPVSFRDSDGNWQQFKSNDRVWDGTEWQPVVCGVPSSSVYVANNYGKPLAVTDPSTTQWSINQNQSRVFNLEGVYEFMFTAFSGEQEAYWKYNPDTYNPSDPGTYETGVLVENVPFSIGLDFGDYFVVSSSQPAEVIS